MRATLLQLMTRLANALGRKVDLDLDKYMTYLALKTMIVQNNIKHINTIGLAAAKAAANPIVCRGLILFCTHCFLG